MKTFFLCALLAFTLVALGNEKRSKEVGNTTEDTFRSLVRMTIPERESFLTTLDREWQTRKGILITTLGSEDEEACFSSAYLLGLYRYAEAADSLAAVITMENKVIRQQREGRWRRYPAVEALIRIGKPSVPAMLRNLASSSDQHVRALSARVIFGVEGEQIGRLIVENAIAKEDDPVKKKNLETSLPLIKGGEYKPE